MDAAMRDDDGRCAPMQDDDGRLTPPMGSVGFRSEVRPIQRHWLLRTKVERSDLSLEEFRTTITAIQTCHPEQPPEQRTTANNVNSKARTT